MGLNKKDILSKLCILLIAAYWIFSFGTYRRWEKNPIVWDVVSYYGYLPAVFIYKDITLHFADKDPDFFVMKYWPERAPNGGRVIKTTMGVSFLYAPFFFLGHAYAGITGEPQDGFSVPYQVFLQIGALFYVLLGFIFLRKLLLKYFSDRITFLTLFSVFFGTNLLFYTTGAALMAHAYLFSVFCVFLFAVDKWHIHSDIKTSVLMGLTGGLLALMKPTLLVCVLIPLLWGVTNFKSLKEKIKFIAINKWKLILLIFFFILPGIPQVLYWKYITGNWFYFSYTGERFFFDNPHIVWGWFSYRNGWQVYTPIMVFALAGFFFMREKIKHMTFSILLFFALSAYIIHSWWCWWHGGYGLRAYIEMYSALALPMAAFYDFLLRKKIVARISIITLTVLLIAFNLFQTWQFERGILHYAWMTKKAYWLGFLKTNVPGEFWLSLQETNIERAKRGLPEYYTDSIHLHHIRQIIDFENVSKESDSVYYSAAVASSEKYSYTLKGERECSPAITVPAFDVVHTDSKETIASAKFYFKKEPLDTNELLLVVSFSCDTGMYYHKAIDLHALSPKPGQWNTVTTKLELEKVKDEKDKIGIYLLSRNPKMEFFIDDMALESIYPKD